MKNSKFVKLMLLILIGAMLLSIATNVFAAASDYADLGDVANGTGNGTNGTNTANGTNGTNTANGTNGTNTGAGLNTANFRNTSSTPTATTGNNTSNTNTSANLPNSGMADSLPVVVLIVIFGISAAYAYKKIQDYKNV